MRVVGALCAVVALAGCEGPFPTPILAQGETLERRLLQCKTDLGFGGQMMTEVTQIDGQIVAVALPFDQIDAAAAQQINVCAGGAMLVSDGMVVVPLTDTAPPRVASAPVSSSRPAGCPVGVTGLYRGNLIC